MATLAELALPRGQIEARYPLPRLPGFPVDLRRLGNLGAAGALARSALQLADADIIVDLGDSIGSGHWWRGFATLGALVGAALALGANLPVIQAAVPQSRGPAALEEARADGIAPLASGSRTGRAVAPTPLARRLAEIPERPRIELTANVGSGGLEAALRRAGVGRADIDRVGQLVSGVANLRGLKPGTSIDLVMGRRESRAVPRPLDFLAFRAAFETRMEVRRGADGELQAKAIPIRIDSTPLRVTGTVGGSLERAARAAGIPGAIVAEYLRPMG
ncbi:MAG: M23 family peptidase, partial [Sandaracinobacteroides sp.]